MPKQKRRQQPGAAGSAADPKPKPRRIADEPVSEAGSVEAGVKSPVTETGLSVEQQIRREWDPKKQGGLPTSLKTGAAKTRAA